MALLSAVLQNFVLSGITGNRADAVLMKVYEKITQKSWDRLYIEAFKHEIQD